MGQKSATLKEPAEQVVQEIARATRRQFSAEKKIHIVLASLRGEADGAAAAQPDINALRRSSLGRSRFRDCTDPAMGVGRVISKICCQGKRRGRPSLCHAVVWNFGLKRS
jgi:transposase